MMACSHPISQCQTLFLAYSRHSVNAACVHMIAEQELAGHHPAWRVLRGLPGVPRGPAVPSKLLEAAVVL